MAEVIQGYAELERALRELTTVAPKTAREGLFMCANHCKDVAVEYAPRSPTVANRSTSLKRKKRTRRYHEPGSLEKSIEAEANETQGSVFVAANAFCVSAKGYNYAPKIHDEQGISWHNLGPGSIAKNRGGRVGGKFILRAIQDSADWCTRAIVGRLEHHLGRAWR